TRTAQNRAWVLSQFGNLRGPGFNSIDEFPYASTLEGGWPFAKGCAVPLKENLIQGGYLRAHYYGILRKPMTQFLVLPVPR
ncbi:NucA/NucB deoxyribonuclease domain-containing protein, partial [Anaerohalosphaeraceae bacterium U12dextr]